MGTRDSGQRDKVCVLVGLQGLGPFIKYSNTGRGDGNITSSKVVSRLKRQLRFGEEIRNTEKNMESQQEQTFINNAQGIRVHLINKQGQGIGRKNLLRLYSMFYSPRTGF